MQEVMTEETLILFVSESRVDKDDFFSGVYQEASHGPAAEVVVIRRDHLIPDGFWYDPKHGAAIKFEMACVNRNDFHINTRFASWWSYRRYARWPSAMQQMLLQRPYFRAFLRLCL